MAFDLFYSLWRGYRDECCVRTHREKREEKYPGEKPWAGRLSSFSFSWTLWLVPSIFFGLFFSFIYKNIISKCFSLFFFLKRIIKSLWGLYTGRSIQAASDLFLYILHVYLSLSAVFVYIYIFFEIYKFVIRVFNNTKGGKKIKVKLDIFLFCNDDWLYINNKKKAQSFWKKKNCLGFFKHKKEKEKKREKERELRWFPS